MHTIKHYVDQSADLLGTYKEMNLGPLICITIRCPPWCGRRWNRWTRSISIDHTHLSNFHHSGSKVMTQKDLGLVVHQPVCTTPKIQCYYVQLISVLSFHVLYKLFNSLWYYAKVDRKPKLTCKLNIMRLNNYKGFTNQLYITYINISCYISCCCLHACVLNLLACCVQPPAWIWSKCNT